MKKIIILLLLSSSVAFSQNSKKYYGSAGIGFYYPNTIEINKIIDKFNSDIAVRLNRMEHFGMMFGINFLFGVKLDYDKSIINFEGGLSFMLTGNKSATSRDANGNQRVRDINLRMPQLNLGAQYLFKMNESLNIGAGFNFNLGSLNIYTRNYSASQEYASYDKVAGNSFFTSAGITPIGLINVQLSKKVFLSFRPAYYFMFYKEDLTELNNTLNPGSGNYIPGIDDVDFEGPGFTINFLFRLGR